MARASAAARAPGGGLGYRFRAERLLDLASIVGEFLCDVVRGSAAVQLLPEAVHGGVRLDLGGLKRSAGLLSPGRIAQILQHSGQRSRAAQGSVAMRLGAQLRAPWLRVRRRRGPACRPCHANVWRARPRRRQLLRAGRAEGRFHACFERPLRRPRSRPVGPRQISGGSAPAGAIGLAARWRGVRPPGGFHSCGLRSGGVARSEVPRGRGRSSRPRRVRHRAGSEPGPLFRRAAGSCRPVLRSRAGDLRVASNGR